MSRFPSRYARGSRRALPSHPAVAGFRPAAAALAVAAAFGLQSAPLRAQPVGGQAIAGQASFARNGNNLIVTTQNAPGTSHSAINWQSFSVPAQSITRFNQPSATSTSINRVLGPDPSSIFGTLSSNGRLVLVNPAGIAVGQGAVVDTAGFTASTLGMSEADAIAGRMRFAGNGGALQVDGTIVARSGDVVLVAPSVSTGAGAVVQSATGATLLAAGRKVEITGRGLEGIRLEVQAPDDKAVNLGTLQGDAVGIFAGTLRHSGLIQARSVSTEGGKVLLRAQGDNLVSGAIDALAASGKGGSIDVLGERVGLLAGAALDASGPAGGGQVRVGGDYQGLNADVPNARRTYVDAQATVKADATLQGDGGRVIVWSDEATRMHGQVSARGGVQGGNGGFAEVSGKQYLDFTGRGDLRAPKGRTGTLLLDPNDIEIRAGAATTTDSSSGGDFSGGTGTSVVNDADLSAQLDLGNVQVATSYGSLGPNNGQITLVGGANVHWGNASALSLNANTGIILDGMIDAQNGQLNLVNQTGDIVQHAGSSIRVAALNATTGVYGSTIGSEGGRVLMSDPGATNTVALLSGNAYGPGNEFRFQNAGTLTIGGSGITTYDGPNAGPLVVGTSSGDLNVTGAGSLQSGTLQLKSATGNMAVAGTSLSAYTGLLALDAAGDIKIGQDGYVSLGGAGGATGGVRINAGGNVDLGPHGTYISSQIAPIDITAGGGILGNGSFRSGGTTDGWIHLTASNGPASFSAVNSNGSYSSTPAGNVRIVAKGDISGEAITANGGYSYTAASPSGGDVWVESSNGNIAINSVTAYGGDNYSSLGAGGTGGAIMLRAIGTGGTVTAANVDADGGYSYNDGGNSGSVVVRADGAVSLGSVTARGGNNGSTGGSAGNGGTGGSIDVESFHGVLALGSADVRGGSSSSLGAGGAGGAISLRAAGSGGTIQLGGNLSAPGGGAADGSGGNGGAIVLQADGNVQLVQVDASGGVAGPAAASTGGDGGTLLVQSNNGNIAFGTTSVASSGGAMVNGGTGASLAAGGRGGAITLEALGTGAGAIQVNGTLMAQGGTAQYGNAGDARNASPGDAIAVRAQRDIDISNVYVDGGGMYSGPGGLGGKASFTSTAGHVRLGPTTAQGSQGGEVRVTAGGGNIEVDSIDVSGREGYSLAAGGNGGGIVLDASGTATVNNALYATGGGGDAYAAGNGGNISVSAGGTVQVAGVYAYGGYGPTVSGGGNGGTIQLHSTGGDVNASSGIDASASYAGNGGTILVQADAGNISLQQVTANGNYAGNAMSGGTGGSITLQAQGTGAESGNVTVTGALDVRGGTANENGIGGAGGTITVQADKQIQVTSADASGGSVSASIGSGGGGSGGSVLLSSAAGGIASTGGINVNGGNGNPGGAAGSVQVLAPGGSAGLSEILAQGGWGNVPGSAGGMGGTVDVQARGDITFGHSGSYAVYADGGPGSGGAGGGGGTVTINSSGGNVTLFDGEVHYYVSASGGNGTEGGAGGQITLLAAQNMTAAQVQANGGDGQAGVGRGGDGGTIAIRAGGYLNASTIYAVGGNGGNGQSLGESGGVGGNGGTIDVQVGAANVAFEALQLAATGGRGGDAYYDGGSIAGAAGGTGGAVTLTTPNSTLSLSGVDLAASGGVSGYDSGDSNGGISSPGGSVTVQAQDLQVDRALSVGGASFTGRATGTLHLAQSISSDAGGDAVVLAANILDVGEVGAINTQNGRWLTYLPGPDGNNFGTLVSGNYALWGRTYTGNPPGSVTETGNRYLFAYQPTVDITAQATSKVYDGTPINIDLGYTSTPLVDASFYGNVFTQDAFTGSLQAPATSRNVGNYTIALGTLGVPGYAIRSFTGNVASITPASVTVAAASDSRTYDGTTNSSAAPVVVAGGLVGGDSASFVQSFDNRNAGTGKTLTVTGSISDGNGGNNYTLTLLPNTNGVITPAPLTVAASADSRSYDGTVASSAVPTVASGTLFGSDTAAFSQVFDNRHAGTGKTLVPAAAIDDGNGGHNYAVTLAPNANGTITPALLTVTASADTKAYDGTTGSAAAPAITAGRLFGSDTVALSQAYADKNAGTGKVLLPAATLNDGNGGGDYKLTLLSNSAGVINPADLTINANNIVKPQNTDFVFDGSEFSATGLAAGEKVASVTLTSAGAPASAPVGAYAIVPSSLVPGANFLASNYKVTYLNGAMAVIAGEQQQQVLNQVVMFSTLFVDQAKAQDAQDRKKTDIGKDDIVVTDAQCKPS